MTCTFKLVLGLEFSNHPYTLTFILWINESLRSITETSGFLLTLPTQKEKHPFFSFASVRILLSVLFGSQEKLLHFLWSLCKTRTLYTRPNPRTTDHTWFWTVTGDRYHMVGHLSVGPVCRVCSDPLFWLFVRKTTYNRTLLQNETV